MQLRARPLLLLAVVVLILIAGFVLQRVQDDGSAPAVPDAELTPSQPSLIPGPGSSAAAAVTRAATTASTEPARDLRADEARGGHTIARHVGRSDEQLRQRLRDEPDISAASTYTDLATAQRVVAEVLAARAADVRKWEQRTGSRANLVLRRDAGQVIGRSIEQGKSRAVDCTDAVVVLRWDGDSWFVLTSYPEDR